MRFWRNAVLLQTVVLGLLSSSGGAQPDASAEFIKRFDKNQDGRLSREEVPEGPRQAFDRVDTNSDGFITREEDSAFRQKRFVQPRPASEAPTGIRALKDVPYVENGHARQTLNLFLPEKPEAGPRPLIIWIHGGGWMAGSKDQCPAIRLTEQGFAVASLGYRLSGDAIFPAQIQDCKAAIRWLRAHAREHGLDPDRFGVWGSSAGGHLVALVATANDVPEWETVGAHRDVSSRVQAACDWFGPTDLLKMDEQAGGKGRIRHNDANSPESKLVGGPITEHPDRARAANPIIYVTKDDPPFLIVHGDADPLVPLGQSELLEAALKQANVPVTLHVVKGGGHGGWTDREPQTLVERFFRERLQTKR